MKRTLSFIAFAAALSMSAGAQVTDDLNITVDITLPGPDPEIIGLSDFSFSYDGTDITGSAENEFCIFSPTDTFNLTLTGLTGAGADFFLQPDSGSGSNIVYAVDVQDFLNSTGSLGSFTPGVPVTIDAVGFADEPACAGDENAMIVISFPLGGTNSIDTVTADELSDGSLHAYSDTLTVLLEPVL
ncbi:MAG: hypothetical protein QNI84_11435 [Henriciella sp.]|nr:hypothetical protein [Henriciella sp.]